MNSSPPLAGRDSEESRPFIGNQYGTHHDEFRQRQSETFLSSSGRVRWTYRNQWILLAISSGACAAFNGVFAKLWVLAGLFACLSSGMCQQEQPTEDWRRCGNC